jgi:hypothetical protein
VLDAINPVDNPIPVYSHLTRDNIYSCVVGSLAHLVTVRVDTQPVSLCVGTQSVGLCGGGRASYSSFPRFLLFFLSFRSSSLPPPFILFSFHLYFTVIFFSFLYPFFLLLSFPSFLLFLLNLLPSLFASHSL